MGDGGMEGRSEGSRPGIEGGKGKGTSKRTRDRASLSREIGTHRYETGQDRTGQRQGAWLRSSASTVRTWME